MLKIKKHILIAIPVLLLGGTEIQTLSLISVLISAGYRVTICCYYEYDEKVVDWFRKAGADVRLLGLTRSEQKFGISTIAILIKKLFSTFRELRPDIVHVQYLAPGLIPILTARLALVPKILATTHIAGSIVYGNKAKILLKLAALLCNRFICVSRGVEEFWFGSSQLFDPNHIIKSRKHYTVYNSIDNASISDIVNKVDKHKIKKELGISGGPVIGIVGRIAHQKGHKILLDAMVEVVKICPDASLLVIGEGPEHQNLIGLSATPELENNIIWIGELPQNKVFELYAIMDIFVMPSLYEGFGLTAAEAMAAGVPVIGTKIEGLSEVIEDGVSGCLVPPGDSQALSEALINLLKDASKARILAENGRYRVENLFSMEKFKNSMIGLYKSL